MNKKISISAELYEKVDEARLQLDISLEEFCESAIASLLVKLPAPVESPARVSRNPLQAKSNRRKAWEDFQASKIAQKSTQ